MSRLEEKPTGTFGILDPPRWLGVKLTVVQAPALQDGFAFRCECDQIVVVRKLATAHGSESLMQKHVSKFYGVAAKRAAN